MGRRIIKTHRMTGSMLDEQAARIFQAYDAGRVTAADALERVRAVLWGVSERTGRARRA